MMKSEDHLAKYTADHTKQVGSGVHSFTAEHKAKNIQLRDKVLDLLPFCDLNKTNDCDLVYRFLIARKWDLVAAEKMLRDYFQWRREENIDLVLWESFDDDIQSTMAQFFGTDKEGQPILWDAPNPKLVTKILKNATRQTMMRAHYQLMERARFLSRVCGVDRITYVLDLSSVTMTSVNGESIGMLKEMSGADQKYYPEVMRRMIVCNGGWAVSAAWKIIRPLLDERVHQKIQFLKDAPSVPLLAEFVHEAQFHPRYVGKPLETTPNELGKKLEFATGGKKGVLVTEKEEDLPSLPIAISPTTTTPPSTLNHQPRPVSVSPSTAQRRLEKRRLSEQQQQERLQLQLSNPFPSSTEPQMQEESDRLEDSTTSSLDETESANTTLTRLQSQQKSDLFSGTGDGPDSEGYYSLPDDDDEEGGTTQQLHKAKMPVMQPPPLHPKPVPTAASAIREQQPPLRSGQAQPRITTPSSTGDASSNLSYPGDQPLTPATTGALGGVAPGGLAYVRNSITPGRLGDGLAVEIDLQILGRTIQGYHQNKLIGESQDNLIVSYAVPVRSAAHPRSDSGSSGGLSNSSVMSRQMLQVGSSASRDPHTKFLIGELLRESGHPIHTFLIVTDASRHAKFVLQRRNFHQQIVIFQVVGDTKVSTNKTYDHSVLGERVKMARCGPPPGADSPSASPLRFFESKLFPPKGAAPPKPPLSPTTTTHVRRPATDWAVWGKVRVGTQEVRTYLAERQANTILFYGTLASLPIYDLFCLAVGLVELWE